MKCVWKRLLKQWDFNSIGCQQNVNKANGIYVFEYADHLTEICWMYTTGDIMLKWLRYWSSR